MLSRCFYDVDFKNNVLTNYFSRERGAIWLQGRERASKAFLGDLILWSNKFEFSREMEGVAQTPYTIGPHFDLCMQKVRNITHK